MNHKNTTPAMNLVVFDDGRGQWGPLTDLRAAFDLPTGMLSPLGRLSRSFKTHAAALFVPQGLVGLTAEEHPETTINALPDELATSTAPCLLAHGGLSTPNAIARAASLEPGQALVDMQGRLAAGCLDPKQIHRDDWQDGRWDKILQTLTITGEPVADLLLYPWDIYKHLEVTLRDDLLASTLPVYHPAQRNDWATRCVATAGNHPIKVASSAKLHPMVVINAEKGPVVIDERAVVGSFAVVAGPCYIGVGSIIAPHTHVRANCSIAGSCVIGGEVSTVVIDQCTNKCHAGYLGNAIVGRWVNLGADTNASNLKNTFGQVRMTLQHGGQPHNSGLAKLGPVIGDFVRTAIGSRLMTGACIGTGSMLAVSNFSPKFVDRFAFVTDQGTERYDIEKFIKTAREMTGRRKQELSAMMEARLRELARQKMSV